MQNKTTIVIKPFGSNILQTKKVFLNDLGFIIGPRQAKRLLEAK